MLGGMCLASYDHSIKVIAHTRNILELMNLVPRLPTRAWVRDKELVSESFLAGYGMINKNARS